MFLKIHFIFFNFLLFLKKIQILEKNDFFGKKQLFILSMWKLTLARLRWYSIVAHKIHHVEGPYGLLVYEVVSLYYKRL
jgi:hypothetical protein